MPMRKRARLVWVSVAILFALTLLLYTNAALYAAAREETFSIIWITDTQHLTQNNPQLNNNLTQWIIDNKQTYNVKMVIHTGDIVDKEGNQTQWQSANQSMGLLLDNSVPYTWNAGNHDFNKTLWIANQYIAFNPDELHKEPYWVSTEYDGMNNAVRFNASGQEWLVVSIAYNANQSVFTWANNILDQHPNAHTIVATHAHLNKRGGYDDWALNLTKSVLDTHPNVFLTVSGHYYPTQGNRTHVGGRDALLFNQQDAYGELGAASARILTFNTVEGAIKVQTFSVYLNQFVGDSNNNFTLHSIFRNVSLTSEGISLSWLIVVVGVVVVAFGAVFVFRRKIGLG